MLTDNTKAYIQPYTEHLTPTDAEYYPGSIHQHPLSADSKDEDFKTSLQKNAENHGAKLPGDYTSSYNNSKFPANIVDPEGDPNTPSIPEELIRRASDAVINDPGYDGVFKTPTEPVDLKAFLPDLNAFGHDGDPRFSRGAALQGAFQTFFPRVDAYEKYLSALSDIMQSGGTQILGEYVCTEDGTPVAKATAEVIQNYGTGENNKVTPPTLEDIKQDFEERKDAALKNHADAFIAYCKKTYLTQGWWGECIFVDPPGFFFIKFQYDFYIEAPDPLKPGETYQKLIDSKVSCLRYYPDQKDYVSLQLGLPYSKVDNLLGSQKNFNAMRGLSLPIPDYTKLA